MRNVVIHEYFGIDMDSLWKTVCYDFPLLEASMRRITDESGMIQQAEHKAERQINNEADPATKAKLKALWKNAGLGGTVGHRQRYDLNYHDRNNASPICL